MYYCLYGLGNWWLRTEGLELPARPISIGCVRGGQARRGEQGVRVQRYDHLRWRLRALALTWVAPVVRTSLSYAFIGVDHTPVLPVQWLCY